MYAPAIFKQKIKENKNSNLQNEADDLFNSLFEFNEIDNQLEDVLDERSQQSKVAAPPARLSFLNQMAGIAKMTLNAVGNSFSHLSAPNMSSVVMHGEEMFMQQPCDEQKTGFTNS